MMSIKSNLDKVLQRIRIAAEKTGRTKEDITLVAVTKTRPMPDIMELKSLGINNIGESRVQELSNKYPELKNLFSVHLIGHLQTNKVKQAVQMANTIHSVDSFKLAESISKECIRIGKTMDLLLQVNTSEETQKSGIAPQELQNLVNQTSKLENIRLIGLMTMAMQTDDLSRIRSCFHLLKELHNKTLENGLDPALFRHLSMGMSHDFEIAIEEGATMVRIGSALFEEN